MKVLVAQTRSPAAPAVIALLLSLNAGADCSNNSLNFNAFRNLAGNGNLVCAQKAGAPANGSNRWSEIHNGTANNSNQLDEWARGGGPVDPYRSNIGTWGKGTGQQVSYSYNNDPGGPYVFDVYANADGGPGGPFTHTMCEGTTPRAYFYVIVAGSLPATNEPNPCW